MESLIEDREFEELMHLQYKEVEREYGMSVEKVLEERDKTHGNFAMNGIISQGLKSHLHMGDNWEDMSADKKEALEMIAHKMSRIVNGDSGHKDSWTDIIGYATLVEKKLK